MPTGKRLTASGQFTFGTLRQYILHERPLRHRPVGFSECGCKSREFIYFTPRDCNTADLMVLEPDDWEETFLTQLHRLLQFLSVMATDNKLYTIHQMLEACIRERLISQHDAEPWTIESDLAGARESAAASYGFSSVEEADFSVGIIWSAEHHLRWRLACVSLPQPKKAGREENTTNDERPLISSVASIETDNTATYLYHLFITKPTVHRFDKTYGCSCLEGEGIDQWNVSVEMQRLCKWFFPPSAELKANRLSLVPSLSAVYGLFNSKTLWPYIHCAIRAAMQIRLSSVPKSELEPFMFLVQKGDLEKAVVHYRPDN